MGFNNPNVPWAEVERVLSDRGPDGRSRSRPPGADGNDSPVWSHRREAYVPPPSLVRRVGTTPYAELHAHSAFSFLDGASAPEAMAEEAARLGLEALALTDHDGLYGVVRFAEAARALELRTIFGAELGLGADRARHGEADPPGDHLLVLARDPEGYAGLAGAISSAHLAGGEKGRPDYSGIDWAAAHRDHWLVLTGCRKGAVPRALVERGPAAAVAELARLVATFGAGNVVVEIWDHGDPLDSVRNDALVEVAARVGVEVVATTNAHYATPSGQRLAAALAAVRSRRSLDEIEGWLPACAGAHLRSGDEQARRFARWPGVVERAAELGRACAFDLRLVAPRLPPFPCPDGLDEMGYLRRLVFEGATRRYGPRDGGRAWHQVDHELALIDELGFPGYFLVVWEIVEFCRQEGILCQGRGSAANSAVCYVLGITAVDAVKHGLLFERFLSEARAGSPPDIDLDIESGRREEVIQHVYATHGRHRTAQVANVISYRSRSAVRDVARALGYAPGQQDAFSRGLDPWRSLAQQDQGPAAAVPAEVVELAREVEHLPRHLGIHSGGMVICHRDVVEVCPVEWARMADRTVLQWDKDDCAAIGLVKFDLLGLGMLEALHRTFDLVAEVHGEPLQLHGFNDDDPEVYDMLCRADSIGVFQVESRAQMATLPRLKPRKLYDLVVEVALIRPGPIQGGSVHPYIRRRNGTEPVSYLHPSLEASLGKTLGVPLFQEQLMKIAMDVAGMSGSEADDLCQAFSSKRSRERLEGFHERFADGARAEGLDEAAVEAIWAKLAAFANYGFPESHAMSFAYLVYASAWLKRYYPAAFCAALLASQPMGFYSPHTLVQDARRHGVEVRGPDLAASGVHAILEVDGATERGRAPAGAPPPTWGARGPGVRLGLASVRHVGEDLAAEIVAGRPYTDPAELVDRVALALPQLEALATAGAFGCFGLDRRAALWAAGALSQGGRRRLPGTATGVHAPPLPGMEPAEVARADLWATGISPEGHPTRFVRAELDRQGVVPAVGLAEVPDGARVAVAGVVTHRQRPATAGGTTFVNLEDETGLVNVVVSPGCWAHHRRVAQGSPALLVQGRLERVETVVNVVAEVIRPLDLPARLRSRDFR
ncbi:MAG: error-prone DNA polymerase [Acidimicrobiia bacterium]